MRLEYDIGVGEQKLARIKGRFARFKDVGPEEGVVAGARAVIAEMVQENFQTQGGLVGGWAPLSQERYRERAERGTLDKGILRDTDRLYLAATDVDDPAMEVTVHPEGFDQRLTVSYAIMHQEGTKHMPARPIFPDEDQIPEQYMQGLRNVIQGFLIGTELDDE